MNSHFLLMDMCSDKMVELIQSWCPENASDFGNINARRPSVFARRLASLAMTRSLLSNKYIRISRQDSGRPYLTLPAAAKEDLPAVSISHSGRWIACLLSDQAQYAAIDIEDMTIKRSHERLAQHAFSPQENIYVQNAGILGFYRLWTAKEALAKCQSRGLAAVLSLDLDRQLSNHPLGDSFSVKVNGDYYNLTQRLAEPDLIYTIAQRKD